MTTATETRDSYLPLNFAMREALRWADGALGICPDTDALAQLCADGLLTTASPVRARFTSHLTSEGARHLRRIGDRG